MARLGLTKYRFISLGLMVDVGTCLAPALALVPVAPDELVPPPQRKYSAGNRGRLARGRETDTGERSLTRNVAQSLRSVSRKDRRRCPRYKIPAPRLASLPVSPSELVAKKNYDTFLSDPP
ncbi:hypothetical protein Bbelb_414050 [Branchiostoma belcheri]|nr:hypothetical protein Bbelb_414050 [Branchiostoma belcheri]